MGEPARKSAAAVRRPGKLTRGLASLLARTGAGPARGGMPGGVPGGMPGGIEGRITYVEVPVDQVRGNSYQPRKEFDEAKLKGLASSLKESGLLQPVVVRRSGGGYELIAGERRLRASKLAGLETIPAIVREVSEDQMLELALVENIQREDLNPIERARAYRHMLTKFGVKQDELAERLSVSRPAVANAVRLLELPESVQEMVASATITAGHARAILAAGGEEKRLELAREILDKGLSVREAEARAGNCDPTAPKGGPRKKTRPAHLRRLEEKFEERLGTRVTITQGKRKGKILIEFYTNDDFERIMDVIGVAA